MTRHVDATFYVQLEPQFAYGYTNRNDTTPINGARAVGMTQKRPDRPKPGSVLIKLTVRIPEPAFRALRPEAVVTIPETLTQPFVIEVEAEDPS